MFLMLVYCISSLSPFQSLHILKAYFLDRDFVFSGDDGSPLHPDSVTTWLDRFAKRHGLPHINPHAFRHSLASVLIFNNVDVVSVSKRLGHSSVSITEEVYAHLIEESEQKNADILADVLLKRA